MIAWIGRMFAHKVGRCELFWQQTKVPQLYAAVVNTHLYGRTGVILMRNCIIQQFTQSRFGNFQLFNPLHTFVMYWRNEVFCTKYINHTACHRDDVALYNILNNKVALVGMETSYLKFGSRKELLHVLAKKKNGGVFKFAIFGVQAQIAQYVFGRSIYFLLIHTTGLDAATQEKINGIAVDIVDGCTIYGNVVPRVPHLFHNKLLEGSSFQLLFGRAAAIVVCSLICDRHIARRNYYLNILLIVFDKKVYISHNAQIIDNFVRYVFHQFFRFRQTYYFLIVVNTDIYTTSLRVGKPTNPFEVFVAPSFFIFYVLTFA